MTTCKDHFLAAAKLKTETVNISAMGQDVEILEFDLWARSELLELASNGDNKAMGLLMMKRCVPALSGATDDELACISPAVIEEISGVVLRLSGLDDDAKKN